MFDFPHLETSSGRTATRIKLSLTLCPTALRMHGCICWATAMKLPTKIAHMDMCFSSSPQIVGEPKQQSHGNWPRGYVSMSFWRVQCLGVGRENKKRHMSKLGTPPRLFRGGVPSKSKSKFTRRTSLRHSELLFLPDHQCPKGTYIQVANGRC